MGQQSRKKKEAREQRERAISAKIKPVREKYAKDWSEGHATSFAADGHYQWMADFVKGRELVLEVGTGDGAGTLALLANGSAVVTIEFNPYCLDLAYQKLTQAGIPLARKQRGTRRIRFFPSRA